MEWRLQITSHECDTLGFSFRRAYKVEVSWSKRVKENIWTNTVKVNNLKYYKTKNLHCLELAALWRAGWMEMKKLHKEYLR